MTEAQGSTGAEHARYAPGTPCWVSLMVHGMEPTQDFYHALFGWEFQPGPQQLGAYVRALLDGREVAGVGTLPPDRRLPVAWTPYLASDDVDATAELVRLCGGTIGVGPLDAAEAGRMAIGSDPAGAVFGIWQGAAHAGMAVSGVPGTPAWNELLTFDTVGVTKFYETVFGFEAEATGPADTDRVTLRVGDRPVAGVHGLGDALPRDRGPHWTTYFEVADVDAALERVVELGGQVLSPARDGERGRVAMVSDLEGARFALVTPGGEGAEASGEGGVPTAM
ncbi:VOC family protein [Streptomyces sp. NPDC048290]|uniref:VOC family protein n=1 Tax=Streptomyces sp. NPDC048290 TaxID=3155811 RepID=UPI0034314EE5